jgi:hypothetical protein
LLRFAAISLGCAALFLACSHSSNSGDATEAGPPVDAAACEAACCTRPDPGSSCADFDGGSCTRGYACPTGLVVTETETCTSGLWQITAGNCPAMGASDPRGCPASQPANDSPCTPPMNVPGQNLPCGYVLDCSPTLSASAVANCNNGKWQTTPLSCN